MCIWDLCPWVYCYRVQSCICRQSTQTQGPSSFVANAAALSIARCCSIRHPSGQTRRMCRQRSYTEPDAGSSPHQAGSRGWAASCPGRAGLQAVHGSSTDWRHAGHAQRCCPGKVDCIYLMRDSLPWFQKLHHVAEHVMLVWTVRQDLGRACRCQSVGCALLP